MGTKVSIKKVKVRKDQIDNSKNCISQNYKSESNVNEVSMSEVSMCELNTNDNNTSMVMQEKIGIIESKKSNEVKRGHVFVACAICKTDYALIEFKASKICDDCIQYIKSTC